MRGLLKKLRCFDYLTWWRRFHHPARRGQKRDDEALHRAVPQPKKVRLLHLVMEKQFRENPRVMVYQEDVLKIGHHFGGLDLADADVLRRLISGKNRGRHHLAEIEVKFFDNCQQKDYDEAVSQEVWRQIESFAGYSFSKAHSASYAVESYQSLYLKSHYPLEVCTAVINNFGGSTPHGCL